MKTALRSAVGLLLLLAFVSPTAGAAGAERAGGTVPGNAVRSDPVGQWPLTPRPTVVHGFDPPLATWSSGHRGVDLAGAVGQAVHSALPGVVSFTGRIAGVRIVVVNHGTTRTTYQPVAASVPVGTAVAAGDVIGHLEWFGTHCSPTACLHWGWIRGTEYLDPLRLVGPLPVRLLPLSLLHLPLLHLPLLHLPLLHLPLLPMSRPPGSLLPGLLLAGASAPTSPSWPAQHRLPYVP